MKRYTKMKDSGVEWIGEIPEHWVAPSIRRFTKVQRGASPRPIDDQKYFDEKGEFAWVRIADVSKSHEFLNETKQSLSELGSSLSVKIFPGELFLSIAGSVGKPIIANIKCCIHDGFVYFPNHNESDRFLYYNFVCGKCFDGLGKHGTQLNLNSETVADINIPLPSKPEQTAIVAFLDEKTSKIDDLIAKKERKIELLKEQRKALINQAVTKGLDPTVPMKDSGVEWIGKIPEGWEIKRIKHIANARPSNVDKHIFDDEISVKLCNYTDVYYNEKIDSNDGFSFGSVNEKEFEKFSVKKGDVILTKDSESADDIGVPAYISNELDNVVCAYHLTQITADFRYAIGEFIFRYIQADIVRKFFELEANGVTRFGLSKATIENLFIPLPDVNEQQMIVEKLNKEFEEINELVIKEAQKIELLKEYRQSLISEIVTGKIDVREEVVV